MRVVWRESPPQGTRGCQLSFNGRLCPLLSMKLCGFFFSLQSGPHLLCYILIQKKESLFFLESGPMNPMRVVSFFLKIKNKKSCITSL